MSVLGDGTVVSVERPPARSIVVEAPDQHPRSVAVVRGPRGPEGPEGPAGAAGSGFIHEQDTPSASWNITHPLTRLPNIAIFIDGEQVEADVYADDTTANITFPSPVSGYAVLV